jgi:cysteinyl-tRNA synthetase
MASELLGETIDIHAGGVDLIFPHHENEIAQSEACHHKTFAKLWAHAEHLLVDHKKMSKSLGNFYTLRDILKMGHSGRAVRFILLQNHYRMQMNFTFQSLDAAKASLFRIDEFILRLESYTGTKKSGLTQGSYLEGVLQAFAKALSDDLNVSEALACLFDMIRHINGLYDKGELSPEDVQATQELLQKMDEVLGIMDFQKQKETIPADVQMLVAERSQVRKEKNWKRSDEIRAELHQKGYVVEDTPDGVRVKKITG